MRPTGVQRGELEEAAEDRGAHRARHRVGVRSCPLREVVCAQRLSLQEVESNTGVLESAKELLASRALTDRVELVPGGFFDSVPSGADAYILKNVLHDWDDERSEEDSDHHATMVDLHMMTVCGEGRERGRAELGRLLEQSGFRLERTFDTPTMAAIVEGVAVDR